VVNGSDPVRASSEVAASNDSSVANRAARYRHILLPFDASAVSRRAFDEALRLARERGARLELFNVFDPATHVSGFEPARQLVDELLPRARTRALADLEAAAQSARAAGVECDVCLVDGDVAELPDAIVHRASQMGADLVVMGTHGRTGVDRFMLGSIAEQLLRRASVPVLLVRTAGDEA